MTTRDPESVALALVAQEKGILAADETVPTLTRRFDTLGFQSTERSRRTYREMLFTCPGVSEFISGAIMYDETIRQKSSGGSPLVKALAAQGILPGIKVDTGAKPLARQELQSACFRPGCRDRDIALFAAARTCCHGWHRFPVGRSKRGPSNGPSERNQPASRPETLENQLLLRTGASGSSSRGLAWERGQSRSRPASPLPPRPFQRGGLCWEIQG